MIEETRVSEAKMPVYRAILTPQTQDLTPLLDVEL